MRRQNFGGILGNTRLPDAIDEEEQMANSVGMPLVEYLERKFPRHPAVTPTSFDQAIEIAAASAEDAGAQKVIEHLRALAMARFNEESNQT